jgi:hypothetical protein
VLLTGIDKQFIERMKFQLPVYRAMLKRLVTGFPPRRPGFDITSDHEGFVVYKMKLGQASSEYFEFPCQFSFHPLIRNHYHPGW